MNTQRREFILPYGKENMRAHIEEEHLAGVLVSELHSYKAPKSGAELVQEALENPIGSPRLCDMAVGKRNIVVFTQLVAYLSRLVRNRICNLCGVA